MNTCNISNGGTHEIKELYSIVGSLTKKINELEKNIANIKSGMKKKYTKKAILEILNDTDRGLEPFISFSEFEDIVLQTCSTISEEMIENIDITLEDLFVETFQNACSTIERRFEAENTNYVNIHLPLIAFPNHKNILFVYSFCQETNMSMWTLMTAHNIQRMIQRIHIGLISRCNTWREVHLPQRDLVTAQDNSIYAYNTTVEHLYKPLYTNRKESAEKYQLIMSKICNANIHSNFLSTKIKTGIFHLFSNFECVEKYYDSHFS